MICPRDILQYWGYLLPINNPSQGYLMLLSEQTQRDAEAIESSCQTSAQRSRHLIKHNPIYYFFFLPLGPAPAPAPGGKGEASPAVTGKSWRGGSAWAGSTGAAGLWSTGAGTHEYFFPPAFFTSCTKAHFPQIPSLFPHLTFQGLGYVTRRGV